jgi:hypothetical protein
MKRSRGERTGKTPGKNEENGKKTKLEFQQ